MYWRLAFFQLVSPHVRLPFERTLLKIFRPVTYIFPPSFPKDWVVKEFSSFAGFEWRKRSQNWIFNIEKKYATPNIKPNFPCPELRAMLLGFYCCACCIRAPYLDRQLLHCAHGEHLFLAIFIEKRGRKWRINAGKVCSTWNFLQDGYIFMR